jgi:hypothetical protein
MSSQSRTSTSNQLSFTQTVKFNFLITFIIIFLIGYIIINFLITNAVATATFSNESFRQSSLFNILNYIWIFLTFAIVPYGVFLFIIIFILMILSFTGQTKYNLTRIFLFTFLILTISLIIHVLIVKSLIDANLDIISSRLESKLDFVLNQDIETLLQFEELGLDQEGIGLLLQDFLLEEYRINNNFLYFLGFYLLTRSIPANANLEIEFLISNDLFFVFFYFFIAFYILFDRLGLSCDCKLQSRIKMEKRKFKTCSPNQLWVLIFILILSFIPLFNLIQLYANQSVNYVRWDDYYNVDSSNSQYFTSNNETNNIILTEDTLRTQQTFLGNPEPYEFISFSEIQTEIEYSNRTSNLIHQKFYDLGSSKFVNSLSFNQFQVLGNHSLSIIDEIFNNFGMLLSNESGFWEYFDYYYYFLKSDYSGVGYKITNTSSNSPSNFSSITLFENNIQQDISFNFYSVNISAEIDFEEEFKTTTIYTKPAIFDIFEGEVISITDPPLDYFIFPDFIQFHNYKGTFSFSENIRYIGFHIELNKDINLDFDNDTLDNSLIFKDQSMFLGNKRNFTRVINDILILDIILVIGFIGLMSIIQILDVRNKKLQQNKNKCEIKKIKTNFKKKYKLR